MVPRLANLPVAVPLLNPDHWLATGRSLSFQMLSCAQVLYRPRYGIEHINLLLSVSRVDFSLLSWSGTVQILQVRRRDFENPWIFQ